MTITGMAGVEDPDGVRALPAKADTARLERALAGLDTRLHAQQAPAFWQLKAPLSSGEVDVIAADLPFRLPAELRTWFGWHDGADNDSVLPGKQLLPLHLGLLIRERDLAEPTPPDLVEVWGEIRPTWFPIATAGTAKIVAECGVGMDEVSSIHVIDHWSGDHWHDVLSPSILFMVETWNQFLDDGTWQYDIAKEAWDDGPGGDLPPHLDNVLFVPFG